MNFKTTYILFALLGVLILVMVFVLFMGPTTPTSGFVFPTLHDKANPVEVSDITRVTIEQKDPSGPTIGFTRDANTKHWQISEPRPQEADQLNIDGLIQQLHGATIDEDAKPETLQKAGLDAPGRLITLEGKGKTVQLTIGYVTPGQQDALVYALSSDAPREPVAIKKSRIEKALEDLPYFRNKDLLGKDPFDIGSLELAEGKKLLEAKKVDNSWRLVQPPYGSAEVETLLSAVPRLSVHYAGKDDSDFVADAVTDLAPYNLDPGKPTLRLKVGRGGEKALSTRVLVIGIGKKVQDAAKKEENRYYAYVDTGSKTPDIVRVEAKDVQPFVEALEHPENLRNKTLVSITGEPDAIDVENSYGNLEFRRPEGSPNWELYRGTTGSGAEKVEVDLLIGRLKQPNNIQSFPDLKRLAELGLGKDRKPDAVVKIYSSSLEKPAPDKPGKPVFKKDAKPLVTLRFGNREQGAVAVERIVGDESTLVMVPENVRDVVVRGPLAYFDKNLPAFNPLAVSRPGEKPSFVPVSQTVTKVVVERNGMTFEVTREKDSDPWKLTKPANLAGRQADAAVIDQILGAVNGVPSLGVVAEKADDATLARDYNLKTPPYRVSITLTPKEGKATTHVYSLGKESADKKGLYAKVSDKDTIYLMRSTVAEPLKKDLQDPTVFRFDNAKVQSVKLSGWKKLLGSPTTRTFEKKDGKWSVKEDATYQIDEAGLEGFLNTLSHLQAERFVTAGKEMSLDQDALEIEIRVGDEKAPFQLLIGGQEGSSSVASSNQLKGDFFLVPTSLFEGPRSKPGWFSK